MRTILNKIDMNTQTNPVILAKINYEKRIGCKFSPNEDTFNMTGIKPKRLTRILSGKTGHGLSLIEANGLSKVFGVPIEQLI
jgi:hypothetical protein